MTNTGTMNWQLIMGIILLIISAYLISSGIGKTDFNKGGLWVTRGLVVLTSIGIMYFTIKNSNTTENKIEELEEKLKPENIEKSQTELQKLNIINKLTESPEEYYSYKDVFFQSDFEEKYFDQIKELFLLNFTDHIESSSIASHILQNFPNRVFNDEELMNVLINRTVPNYHNIKSDKFDNINAEFIKWISDNGGFEVNDRLTQWYLIAIGTKEREYKFLNSLNDESVKSFIKNLPPF